MECLANQQSVSQIQVAVEIFLRTKLHLRLLPNFEHICIVDSPAGAIGPPLTAGEIRADLDEMRDFIFADFTKSAPGFVGAFGIITHQSNPDVKAFAFQ